MMGFFCLHRRRLPLRAFLSGWRMGRRITRQMRSAPKSEDDEIPPQAAELVLVNDVPYAREIQFDSPLEEAVWERTRLP